MSERFIQSQYLIQQITEQFFNNNGNGIRVKGDITDSDDEINVVNKPDISDTESDLEETEEEETYHFLETNESELNYIFDLCDDETDILREYTIHICGYKMVQTETLPFLQYILNKGGGELKFPSLKFKCATNIIIDENEELPPKHIYFQNECSKFILQYASPLSEKGVAQMYKGFVKDEKNENVLYVFFDLSDFSIDTTKNSEYRLCIIDEIVNKHKSDLLVINSSVYNIFYQISSVMTIKDKWGKRITIPFLLYSCEYTEEGYKNTYKSDSSKEEDDIISIIDDRINDPNYGSIYLFSTRPLKINEDKINDMRRNVVFCIDSLYILQNKRDPLQESDFRLGNIIPLAVKYVKNKITGDKIDETKDEETPEPETKDEETPEPETNDEETPEQETKDEETPEPETKDEETPEQETKDEETPEQETKDEETKDEDDDIMLNEMDEITDKVFSSIYFHEMVNETRESFWGIKSNIQFTSL